MKQMNEEQLRDIFLSEVKRQEEFGMYPSIEDFLIKILEFVDTKDLRYQEMVGKLGKVKESLEIIQTFTAVVKGPPPTKEEANMAWDYAENSLTLLSEIMKDA